MDTAKNGKINWVDKIWNEVSAKVEEDRQIIKMIRKRQHFEAS